MEKIVVTTDQSLNSKSALRFAINLAKLRNAELTVVHIYHLGKPIEWSESNFRIYEKNFKTTIEAEVFIFVKRIARSMDASGVSFKVLVIDNPDVAKGLRDFARQQAYSFLCIAGKAAGVKSNFFGRHSSTTLGSSKIPVICVPSVYLNKHKRRLLYAKLR